jgi:hypothetical protein
VMVLVHDNFFFLPNPFLFTTNLTFGRRAV